MMTPEGREKLKVKNYLDSIGAWHFAPYMAGYGKAGIPDRIASIYGRLWGIEIKAEGKRATALQQHCLDDIKRSGGFVVCGTAEQIKAEIEKFIGMAGEH